MTKLGALAKAVKIGISFFALQVKDNIIGMLHTHIQSLEV